MRAHHILGMAMVTLLPSRLHAQAQVSRIVGPQDSAIPETSDIELIRLGSVRPETVRQGDQLKVGDELRAGSGNTVLVLACSDSASVTLHGKFRAVIMVRSAGEPCFLDLLAGDAHVLGTATGVGVGEVTMGAPRTEFDVSVSVVGGDVRRDLNVFEGEVEVRSTALPDGQRRVPARTTLTIQHGTYDRRELTSARIDAAARVLTRVDASGKEADARVAAAASLFDAYRQVLADPRDTGAQVRLIATQISNAAASPSTVYRLQRIRAGAPPASQLQVTATVLGVAVYTQLGREESASAGYHQLASHDQQAMQHALRAYRIEPAVVLREGRFEARARRIPLPTLRVAASANPSAIRPGGRSSVIARVTTGSGGPVAGATVKLSAGGGAFANGATSVEGLTNAAGEFVAVWSCSSCAAGYQFLVEVAKEGFVAGRANVVVRIQ